MSPLSGLEHQTDDRCFMLGWLDQPAAAVPRGPREELARLTAFFEDAVVPAPPPAARPLYDPAGLAFAVQAAAGDFHSLWDARLGYRHRDGVSKEHWSRVKALTRRGSASHGQLSIQSPHAGRGTHRAALTRRSPDSSTHPPNGTRPQQTATKLHCSHRSQIRSRGTHCVALVRNGAGRRAASD